jgi:hypothetical protein
LEAVTVYLPADGRILKASPEASRDRARSSSVHLAMD